MNDLNILAEKYGLDKSISTGCHNYILVTATEPMTLWYLSPKK